MNSRGCNAEFYADAFVELYKMASMLDIWDKKRESQILTAVMQGDDEAFKNLSVTKPELISLHGEIKTALHDASSPEGVSAAIDEIFETPMRLVGAKMSRKKYAAKPVKETTVQKLDREIGSKIPTITRVSETAKMSKPKKPANPLMRNKDLREERIVKSETSEEYYKKLSVDMPAENEIRTGYEDLGTSYPVMVADDVNKKRFKMTSDAHKEKGVVIAPSYMCDGIMYRADIAHMIMEAVAKRTTTGLSVYVGAVPVGKENLNTIGDLAMRLMMHGDEMEATKVAGLIFSSMIKNASNNEELCENIKTAYNNSAFDSHGLTDRVVIYPVRPESNILQYAHNDKAISIDARSLSGVLMRADVKQNILTRLSTKIPLGKTSEDLKIHYVRLIESSGLGKAAKFKKACKELYDVDCGDLDDKILDKAHDKSVRLQDIENALFPTEAHQQQIDSAAATSKPTGEVSDAPVKFSMIDTNELMEKFVTAKRKATVKKPKAIGNDLIKMLNAENEMQGLPEEEIESIVPGEIEVVSLGDKKDTKQNKNLSVNMNTCPNTGKVMVNISGSTSKEFDSMEEAVEWARKASEIFNNVMGASVDIEADLKFSELLKLAKTYNAFVSGAAKLVTFSHNLNELMGLAHDTL